MTSPPAAGRGPQQQYGIATAIASSVDDVCPDEAALIAASRAEGRRMSPSRARMLVAQYLPAADARADRAGDQGWDEKAYGQYADETPRDAFLPPGLRRSA